MLSSSVLKIVEPNLKVIKLSNRRIRNRTYGGVRGR